MVRLQRVLVVGTLLGMLGVTCFFSKMPGHVGKVVLVAKGNIEQMLTKSSPRNSRGFDVVTSASIMIEESVSDKFDTES